MLKYILEGEIDCDELIIVTDEIPIRKKRDAVEKGVKMTLARMLPDKIPYRVLHHSSESSIGIQIADYCTWAIFRKWADGDKRSYDLFQAAIKSEFDIFAGGTRKYYQKNATTPATRLDGRAPWALLTGVEPLISCEAASRVANS